MPLIVKVSSCMNDHVSLAYSSTLSALSFSNHCKYYIVKDALLIFKLMRNNTNYKHMYCKRILKKNQNNKQGACIEN